MCWIYKFITTYLAINWALRTPTQKMPLKTWIITVHILLDIQYVAWSQIDTTMIKIWGDVINFNTKNDHNLVMDSSELAGLNPNITVRTQKKRSQKLPPPIRIKPQSRYRATQIFRNYNSKVQGAAKKMSTFSIQCLALKIQRSTKIHLEH